MMFLLALIAWSYIQENQCNYVADESTSRLLLTIQCPKGQFLCNSTDACVEQKQNCDGHNDCEDGSDEWNCKNIHDDSYWDNIFNEKRPDADRELLSNKCELVDPPKACKCSGGKLFCENLNLTVTPKNLPHNVTELDLSGNNFEKIQQNDLQNLSKLQYLWISNCHIKFIDPNSFHGLKRLKKLRLLGNYLEVIKNGTFSTNGKLTQLDLSHNKIKEIESGAFNGLNHLENLNLKQNYLSYLYPGTFETLYNLKQLYLDHNYIEKLEMGLFRGLENLTTLYINHNKISCIERYTFNQLIQLKELTLASNKISELNNETFQNLNNLLHLFLENNVISNIEPGAFSTLYNLESLNLQKNSLRNIAPHVFEDLKALTHIYFPKFYMCVHALHVRICEPKGDGISSIENLLDNLVLRISVWVVASLSCVGNAIVLIGRILSKEDNQVHSFFIKNLSLADLFMGIYLFIIGGYDVTYRGEYIKHEQQWRASWQCNFSGFLSTLSSEVSVIILTVITLDRYTSIIYPLSLKRRTLQFAYILMLTIWLICCTLTILPVLKLRYFGDEFYGNNGVCLPLHIHEPYAEAWEYSAFMFLGINVVSFLFIVFAYVRMFFTIKQSKVSLRSTQENQDRAIAKRFAFIVSTDFICWMPIIIVKILALAYVPINENLYAWLAVFILPVNCALNPILYTLTTKLFKQQLRKIYKRLQKASGRRSSGDTSDISLSTMLTRSTKTRTSVYEIESGCRTPTTQNSTKHNAHRK